VRRERVLEARGERRWQAWLVVLVDRVVCAWRWLSCDADVVNMVAEGEDVLVEDDVSRRDDAPGGDVVASVTAVIRRVADEDAGC